MRIRTGLDDGAACYVRVYFRMDMLTGHEFLLYVILFDFIARRISRSHRRHREQLSGCECSRSRKAGAFFAMVMSGEIGLLFLSCAADTALSENFCFLHPDPSFLSASRLVNDIVP